MKRKFVSKQHSSVHILHMDNKNPDSIKNTDKSKGLDRNKLKEDKKNTEQEQRHKKGHLQKDTQDGGESDIQV